MLKGKLNKFAPIVSIRDVIKADGSIAHEVAGIATAEVADADNEICDYEDSKPFYQKWSQAAFEATTGAGQDPSYGNIRLQHSTTVAGKITGISFDDAAKTVSITTEPIDDNTWTQVKKGFYTGFSQGGGYLYRRCNTCWTRDSIISDLGEKGNFECPRCKKNVQCRYACDPNEVSYVDSPCLKKARFAYVKADGATEEIEAVGAPPTVPLSGVRNQFPVKDSTVIHIHTVDAKSFIDYVNKISIPSGQFLAKAGSKTKTKRKAGEDLPASAFAIVGDSDDPKTWHLPVKFSTEAKTKRHIRNALARIGQVRGISEEQRAAALARLKRLAAEHDIEVSDDANKGVGGDLLKVKKSMYQVGLFARLLEDIKYLRGACMSEAEYEDDPRDEALAGDINDWLGTGAELLVQMVQEEASELTAVAKTVTKGEGTMNETVLESLLKAAKGSLAAHFGKAAAHHEKLAEQHKAMAEEHMDLHDMHKGMMGGDGDMEKAMNPLHKAHMAHHKAMAGHHEKMHKVHMAHCDHCAKMQVAHDSEPPAKMPGTQGAPTKVETTSEVVKVEPVVPAVEVQKAAPATVPPATETATANPGPFANLTVEQFGEMISQAVTKAVGNQIQPTEVKGAGPQLIDRQGNVVKAASAGESSDLSNCGI